MELPQFPLASKMRTKNRYIRQMRCLVAILLAFCACAIGGEGQAQRNRQIGPMPAPRIDHHQHLFSPTLANLVNGEDAAEINLPSELAALLEARVAAWNSSQKLQLLLTPDAETLSDERRGWIKGRDPVSAYLSTRFAKSFDMVPTHYRGSGGRADIMGYYSRGAGGEPRPFAYFLLSAEKTAPGPWHIVREVVITSYPPLQKAITGDQLIKMLDDAHIRRATVLSEAFWYDGPYLKIADPYPKVMRENDWTAEQVARYPDRLAAFCSFNPVASYAAKELERCAQSGKFKGLKFSFAMSGVDLTDPVQLKQVQAIFAAANAKRLPIVVHLSNGATYGKEHVELFLQKIMPLAPDIDVQVAHLWGGEAFSKPALDAFVNAYKARIPSTKRLYFDLSEVWTAGSAENLALAAKAIRAIGLKRMLYGSDAALNGRLQPSRAWSTLRLELPLTDSEFRQIAEQTAPYFQK